MFRSVWACATLCALAAAAPANAAEFLFENNNNAATINFDGFVGNSSGVIPGLSSTLTLRLLSGAGTKNLVFSYVLENTSISAFDGSRVSGFSFDADPDVHRASIVLGDFSNINMRGMNYPNGIGDVEICLNDKNSCAGGGNGGATIGNPVAGEFTLSFLNAPMDGVTLDRFYARYQSLPFGEGSASGQAVTTAVPEPGSWMLMLAGFFALGFALRRRSTVVAKPQMA
ncbi:cistern family PEP-CTERM protein [Erythrobacter sp.]|uniref:cistern family PEP-CTERM protein n=1 Tax=Erythrobacter sp. TaxID=1042 RepID=UPI0025F212B5|nr:cistern family PEP-CTERM protein [Erythrobacter sp.]